MIQRECPYCGAVASSYLENCEICGSIFPVETAGEKETGAFNERRSDAFSEKARTGDRSDFSGSAARKNDRIHKCLVCGQPALVGRSRCFDCGNSTGKKTKAGFEITGTMIALIIFGVISILGTATYFYFGRTEATPEYILKQYEAATGIDKSLTYKNYVLKGKGTIGLWEGGRIKKDKDFLFILTVEKPEKFSAEYWAYDSKEPSSQPRLILKQIYDGSARKQFDNFAAELSGEKSAGKITELPNGEASISELGLGFGDDADYEITENNECRGLNRPTCDFVMPVKHYKVDNQNFDVKPSRQISLQVSQKTGLSNGTNVLEFDGDKGFLLANIRHSQIGDKIQRTEMTLDEYKNFPAPSKGFFGAEQTTGILMPTKLKISSTIGTDYEMKIYMNFDSLEFNQKIDENIYDLPPVR